LIIKKKEVNVNTFNINIFKMNKISNISPLRYPGGKTRACKKKLKILILYNSIMICNDNY